MLLVKTKLGKSRIHGIGLFADQEIPKGKIIWKFKPGSDLKFDRNHPKKLPKSVREWFLSHAFLSIKSGKFVLCSDNANFINHSNIPDTETVSLESEEEVITIAARNIKRGEEITENYDAFASSI